jgi:PAS domain S-box-containing protein
VESIFTNLLDEPSVEAIVINFRDITESKQVLDAQRKSELQFRALFELSPDAVMLIDPHDPNISWPIIDCNPAACQMNGYDRDELIGHSIDIVNTIPGVQTERNAYLERLREAGSVKLEAFHRHKNGTIFPIEVATSLIVVGGRELLIGIDRDISERKQAEKNLLESESRYRTIFDGVQDAIFVETKDGRILEVNNTACEMYGYKRDEFLQKTVSDFVLEGSPVFAPHLQQKDGPSVSFETVNRRANGELFPIEISGGALVINGEEVLLAIVRDITARKQDRKSVV